MKKAQIFLYEIIFINDCSTDNTEKVIKDIIKKKYNHRLINNTKNLGLGASVLKGFKNSNSHYCTYVPGDNSHPYDGLYMIYKHIHFKSKMLIIPYVVDKSSRNFLRIILSNCYTLFINLLFKLKIPYYNSLAVYPTDQVNKLNIISKGFSFQSEIIIRLLKNKIRYKCVKTILKENKDFFSSALYFKNLKSVIYSIISLRTKI